MEIHGDPIQRKKKGANVTTKKRKIKSVKTAAVEKECTYVIDSLDLADTAHAQNDVVLTMLTCVRRCY